jgi:hypothetical protein
MLMRREFRLITVALAALLAVTGTASAQKKSAKKTTSKKTSPAPATKIVPPLDVRAGREKVDNQLSNVNDFVNKLGPIAQNLETADADAKAGKLKPATADKIRAKTTELVEAMRNIRTGLTNLESEFRVKPALQKYLSTIEGITDLAARSEDFAIAGKFVSAKDPLREVAKKLTDTLATLPL